MATTIRIGSGHDTHRLETGKPLILGGVPIEYAKGLAGHSDADVVLHALTDALLGAAALGDIGDLFPDTDPRFKGQASSMFVEEALKRVKALGYKIGNIDVTLFAEQPKLGSAKQTIRSNLAQLLGIGIESVSVKAKTGEKVGHIGRGEAIGCHVAVLIQKI